jgi:hypothetical protein
MALLMKRLTSIFRYGFVAAFLFAASGSLAAQTEKELAEALQKRQEVEAKVAAEGAPSLRKLSPKERFVSVDGGFSIGLFKEAGGSHTAKHEDGFTTVTYHMWVTEEAGIVVGYADNSNPKFIVETDEQLIDYFAGIRNGLLRARKGTLLTQKPIIFAGLKGLEFSFRLPDDSKVIARAFFVRKRGYTLIANLDEGAAAERLAWRAFDSFKLLPTPK